MNTATLAPASPPTDPMEDAVRAAFAQAAARIAPVWPLDRFIAVNPAWEYRDLPVETVAARWWALAGIRLVPGAAASPVLPTLVDALDARRDLRHAPPWREVMTQSLGQFFAAWFDEGFALWRVGHAEGLYAAWRKEAQADRGLPVLLGRRDWAARMAALPTDLDGLQRRAAEQLGLPASAWEPYAEALLLGTLGWASRAAYLRWQARLAGREDDGALQGLLAVRLAWELALDDGARDAASAHAAWLAAWRDWPRAIEAARCAQAEAWASLAAREAAFRAGVFGALGRTPASAAPERPSVQAVFCIDVRSEPFRRALEATAPEVQTLGFAGFFGLPIALRPLGTAAAVAQLPGLLAPALTVTETSGEAARDLDLARARQRQALARRQQAALATTPSSMFGLVETLGLFKLPALLGSHAPRPAVREGLPAACDARIAPQPPAGADAVALAAKALRAMSLTRGFARLLVLVGHGSTSTNNPHAAGLDCGACGGQTGEANARLLAALLNQAEVRAGLAREGIVLPADTVALAGLHDTTLDEVRLFDTDTVPPSHAAELAAFEAALARAGARTRAERAPALGLPAQADAAQLLRAVRQRANDWSQTRPEWGLAGNAAIIFAPRARTRGANLQGRCFLHDYRWQDDADAGVLELLMTAPMVVAQWINFQYYASTVDNERLGSGNKLLHNVVGGNLGVFEGNGGDLRIGLPLQSLHDGRRWMHEPLRLCVLIEAPRDRILSIVRAQTVVQHLVAHGWLQLWRIGEAGEVEPITWPPAAQAQTLPDLANHQI
ncbi:MAG: DUF2309 domain-containing protein [Pseudomonadota bacterium]